MAARKSTKRTVKKRTPRKKAANPRAGEKRDKPGRPPIVEKGWNELDRTWHPESPCGKLLAALRAGNYVNASCRFAGISQPTWSIWMSRAREHHVSEHEEPDWDTIPESERPYVALFMAAQEAEAWAEVELVNVIKQCAKKGDWRAAIALLSRRHPGSWRERTGVDVGVSATVELRQEQALKILGDGKVQDGVAAVEAALAALTTGDDVDG